MCYKMFWFWNHTMDVCCELMICEHLRYYGDNSYIYCEVQWKYVNCCAIQTWYECAYEIKH